MEIRFSNVAVHKQKRTLLKNLNFRIKAANITGLYGDNLKLIPSLLLKKINYRGQITIDEVNLLETKKIVTYIDRLDKDTFLTKTVSEEFYLQKHNLQIKEEVYLAKILSVMEMVGLTKTYLKKEIKTLSKSEKRLLQIALNLISNPDVIMINEPFLYLTKKERFMVKKVLLDLKRKYQKIVIVLSNDVNLLYELTTNLIIFKGSQVLVSGKTLSLLGDINFLEKNNLPLPELLLFNKIAYTYGKKLPNYKEVNDLIKGVYRYVNETHDEA